MARSTANKLYRTFVGGLITEASPLTYPENASIDEDNCVIFRKGNRTRRLGVEYETGFSLSTHSITQDNASTDGYALKEYTWFSANNKATVNFLVTQVGSIVYFYDVSGTSTSTARKPFTINLDTYRAPTHTITYDEDVEFSSGRGFLFIAGPKIEPLIVEYDEDTDTIEVDQINILIRDFDGLDDGLANDEEPSTLSAAHHYNLRNQGWIDATNTGLSGLTARGRNQWNEPFEYIPPSNNVITEYFNEVGRYPGNNKQWWVARLDADDDDKGLKAGDFDPDLLKKEYFGNTHAPQGHYIFNPFNKDRSAVSGVIGLDTEAEDDRPSSVTFFAGRAWYAHGSDVYFSQVLIHKRMAGFCYQDADPTAENISDLIDTDGGHIPVPEARHIRRILSSGSGIMVFADNGVWYISGTSAGFTASDYSLAKVSSAGIEAPNSIVEAGSKVYWWSQTGIQGVEQQSGLFGPIAGSFSQSNISQETIQTLINDTIPSASKRYIKGLYDPAANIIQWLWATSAVGPNYMYDKVLNLDLTLEAFYPWTVSKSPTDNGPYISGLFTTPTVNQVTGAEDVVDGVNNVLDSGIQVVANAANLTIRNRLTKFVFSVPTDSTTYKFTHGLFNNADCADWEVFSGSVGYSYNSFVETGYELFDDAMRPKQANYVFCYFKRSEQNFVAEGSDFTVDFPSSCKMRAKWDWADSNVSGRWSREVEAYRHSRVPFVDESNLAFDNGFPVVVTKNKVRGHGRAIQLRFSSDTIGSNFDLLGWAVAASGNTKP